ncbi:MAG: preprotein translocase subunit SecG [Gemmatimonadaceae bacterium]
MYTVLIFLLVLISLVLIAAILLQSGKGGGLAASFGGASSSADSFVGTRQAANLLTRLSWWGAGLFLFVGFVLSLMSSRTSAPRSVLDRTFSQPARTAPAPATTPSTVPLEPAAKAPAPAPPAPTKTKQP